MTNSFQMFNYENHSIESILDSSSKVITFIDLAGSQKYLKTTVFGLTGHSPDYAALVVNTKTGLGKMVINTKTGLGKQTPSGCRAVAIS